MSPALLPQLSGQALKKMVEAKVLARRRWRQDNAVRPQSALGYRPAAPQAVQPQPCGSATPRLPAPAGPPPRLHAPLLRHSMWYSVWGQVSGNELDARARMD